MKAKDAQAAKLVCAAAMIAGATMASPASADVVTVFAASSLQTALDRIAVGFAEATDHEVLLVYGASSTLSRQISEGAPAQVFISANPDWMDVLDEAGALAAGSRVDLLTNTLVLVGQQGPAVGLDQSLIAAVGDGYLAMAEVTSVPAGIYGKAALETLGLWGALEPRVVQTDNVRAATALVALGEAEFGIVYASDAVADPSVHVRATFADDSHPPIIYPAAIVAGDGQMAAGALMDYLQSAAATEVFLATGFGVLP